MSQNKRRTLAIKIETPGGDDPLRMQLVGHGPFYRGVAVSGLALVARGGTAPYAFSIISGGDTNGGVNGLTLNTDGTFSGSGDAAGRFVFVARVQDAGTEVFTHSFSLTFLPQLIVVAGTPTPGENLLSYSYQFIVRDLTGTTITSGYSISAGTITDGLSLTPGGLLSGSPSFASIGFNYFTVRVTNGSDSIDIPVVQRIYQPLLSFGIEFKTYLYAGIPQTLSAYSSFGPTGGLEPYHIRWDNLDDYPWLTYDDNTKTFSGVSPLENIGVEQTLTGTIVDGLGATLSHLAKFTPVFAQAGIDIYGTKVHAAEETGYLALGSSDGSIDVGFDTSGGIDLKAIGGGSGQAAIQFKDEGSNLGSAGTATSFNVVGAGATATRVGNAVTVTIPGGITFAIQTINGVGPDSSGNLHITGVSVDSNGDLFVAGTGSYTPPVTTKGDLFGFSTAAARIPVGANDLPLVADSSASLGVSYKALPIAGGGTGQATKTAAFNALSPETTKGDLEAHNGTNVVRLPVGTDGQILRANSAQSTGLEYITSALLPFAPLATEILADSPLNYFKLNETSGNYIDYGSSGNNLTPVGTVVTNYVQAFSRQINSINDKFLRIVTVTSGGGAVSAQPTGLTLNGSWTVCAVYSQRNSSAAVRTFLQVSNSAASSNVVFCGLSASNVMNILMNAGAGGASTNVTAQVVFNPPLGSGTFIYHFTKDSSTRTFSFWCNGIFLGSNTYSAPNEWTGTLTSPKLTVGADQAAQNSAVGLLSNVALFSGVLTEARIIAHAQAAGLYCS